MKSCDLRSGAAKLELAVKTFRVTLASVEQQWNDESHRRFRENHLAAVEPHIRNMNDAIGHLAEAIAAAERDCGSERE